MHVNKKRYKKNISCTNKAHRKQNIIPFLTKKKVPTTLFKWARNYPFDPSDRSVCLYVSDRVGCRCGG